MLKRVAIAAVFANGGEVLLSDEPFGALDCVTRRQLQDVLLDLWEEPGRVVPTVLFVTHDVDEALTIADRIVAMRVGAIVDDIPVRAARPRDTDSLLLPDMVAIKHKLLGHLGLEHRAQRCAAEPRRDRGIRQAGMDRLARRLRGVRNRLGNPFERDFGRRPTDVAPARVSQVAVDSLENVHVLRRGSRLCSSLTRTARSFAATGRARSSIRTAFRSTAGTASWIADRDAHQIVVFNLEGESLLRIGDRHAPRWMAPFNHPTRPAVAPDGEIYVADGYGNARIHRLVLKANGARASANSARIRASS
jgi:hypothetical protein